METPIFESALLPLFISYQKRANFEKKNFHQKFRDKNTYFTTVSKKWRLRKSCDRVGRKMLSTSFSSKNAFVKKRPKFTTFISPHSKLNKIARINFSFTFQFLYRTSSFSKKLKTQLIWGSKIRKPSNFIRWCTSWFMRSRLKLFYFKIGHILVHTRCNSDIKPLGSISQSMPLYKDDK